MHNPVNFNYRSEEMCHCKIRIPTESSNDIMFALGSMENAIEFIDLTQDDLEAKKTYGSVVKRCEEMIGKIFDLERISDEFHQAISAYISYPYFEHDLKEDKTRRDKKFGSTYFDLIETEVLENDKKIKDLTNSHAEIREDLIRLIEKRSVIKKYKELMGGKKQEEKQKGDSNIIDMNPNPSKDQQIGEDSKRNAPQRVNKMKNLNFITGVIKATDEMRLKKMVFRVSRGIALITFHDLVLDFQDLLFTKSIKQRGFSFSEFKEFRSSSDLEVLKNMMPISFDEDIIKTKKKIYMIIVPGGEEKYLESKLLKVCDIFQVSRYNMPDEDNILSEMDKINLEFSDKKEILVRVEASIKDILRQSMGLNGKTHSNYALYKLFFIQEKMIYYTMNKCLMHDNFIDGEVWIPLSKLEEVKNTLKNLLNKNEDRINASLTLIDPEDEKNRIKQSKPPTFISTNEFLWPFQEIVNTYGIPDYMEVNPALFNVISFPFLFGLMFGDIGHGLLILLFALYLCHYRNDLIKGGSTWSFFIKIRFILLLMGFFSLFCGICYNEFFSVPLDFTSCYQLLPDNSMYVKTPNCNYVLGFDPRWISANNELTYGNSFKMKFSVIIGVVQMSFGIVIKGINAAYHKDGYEFFFKFIPQIIFMLMLFGYMSIMIIIKWCTNWEGMTHLAPDIKSMLMGIFLKFGKVSYPLWGTQDAQESFHIAILFICIGCIIFMFLPTTLLNYCKAKRKYRLVHENVEGLGQPLNQEQIDINQPPMFSDFFVHDLINTIEFVLGSISNTASYLRLWALSLAHTQLAKVFLEQTILSQYFSPGEGEKDSWIVQFIKIIIMYVFWAYFTLGVLLFMDLLECFLHTLRLHWVEFQGKFFKASGYLFSPFSFSLMLKKE